MRQLLLLLSIPATLSVAQDLGTYPITFSTPGSVRVSDGFWSPRLDTNVSATVPHLFDQCEATGRIDNFLKAAGRKEGYFEGWWFNDSDVYKALEAAAYVLAMYPDPSLEARVDTIISAIAAAQEPDGYLFTPRRTTAPDYRFARYIGTTRWDSVRHSHELYDLGHMYEAAIAYYKATGKRTLLDVAIRSADLLLEVFGPGKSRLVPGHQEIEIGLVKLYRTTGNRKYAELAKFFLDERGRSDGHALYGTYNQDHMPVVEQAEAVGHAVRALYMYAGMADIVALYGDTAYARALDRLWDDVVGKKIYVTGGIGAEGGHEGFAEAFQLPNRSAYCETCAGIANVLWNGRMFRLHGDAKYVDVLERSLYNSVLSGVSYGGRTFFYDNPLESDGSMSRSPWFAVACCPPNIARIIPQVAAQAYAFDAQHVYLNLFIQGGVTIAHPSGTVRLDVATFYPYEGGVRIVVKPERPGQEFTLKVRIPGWARGETIPLGLYSFLEPSDETATLTVNGDAVPLSLDKGYAAVKRSWHSGDIVELVLPMAVRRVVSRHEVEANRERIALQRGPLVFCVEGVDTKDGHVTNLVMPDDAFLLCDFRTSLFGGIPAILASARGRYSNTDGTVRSEASAVNAIPYFAWANRGRGEMQVWLARTEGAAEPVPPPTLASEARPSSSGGDAGALNDQREPKSSIDRTYRYLHWWPRKGTAEWVQYDFAEPTTVSSVQVYWYDDTGIGECRVPKSWSLSYRDGDDWKPVDEPSVYGTDPDVYNVTRFSPVKTMALRIEVALPDSFSSGIHEWKVE